MVVRVIFSFKNHGLWEANRVSTCMMDRTCLRRWVNCRKESYFLDFMYVDVARDFVGIAHFLNELESGYDFRLQTLWGRLEGQQKIRRTTTEERRQGDSDRRQYTWCKNSLRSCSTMQRCPIEKIVTMQGKERLGEIKGISHMVGPLVRSLRCTCAKLQNTRPLFLHLIKEALKGELCFILSIFVGFKITLRMD